MHLLEAKIFANALNQIPELGSVRLAQLLAYFGSWAKAWTATTHDYIEAGMPINTVSKIIARKSKINPELSFAELSRRQIEIILSVEPEYPQLLKEISAPPPLLYAKGNKNILNSLALGIVGTRKISLYGKQVCIELVSGLVQNKINIISGLAFGVDAEALSACVENEGVGVAVLASDLDDASIAPRSNYQLAKKVMDKGCLVSEYALGSAVQKQNFPIRNRIISGMGVGTIIIEADIESGALITANYALEQNREVFAVPGSIFSPVSRGTNELIRKGAHIVTGVGSILDELNIESGDLDEPLELDSNETEQMVLTKLTREPTLAEELIRELKIPASELNACLTMLEMKGRVKNVGGAKYVKLR